MCVCGRSEHGGVVWIFVHVPEFLCVFFGVVVLFYICSFLLSVSLGTKRKTHLKKKNRQKSLGMCAFHFGAVKSVSFVLLKSLCMCACVVLLFVVY